jgi:hypothetical protein
MSNCSPVLEDSNVEPVIAHIASDEIESRGQELAKEDKEAQ